VCKIGLATNSFGRVYNLTFFSEVQTALTTESVVVYVERKREIFTKRDFDRILVILMLEFIYVTRHGVSL
jgi:hypothetical protein